ncbi:MAG: ERAP1-like C-terminal domain-containing protein, partial [Anaerolineales bacterium]
AEAIELFDAITYTKGCAVLRMLETFLGAEAFRAGLRTYMQEFRERNARGADLWQHLQAASQQPVTDIMQSWIMQSGYPCVAVALDDTGNQTRLRVRQQRFFSSPNAPQDNPQIWSVPLVIRYADEAGTHETRHILWEREAILPLAVAGALRWCYANADEVGFYRQNLAGSLLTSLLAELPRLTASEQMGLLSDQWALTRSGQQAISRFLEVLAACAGADHYNVLAEVVDRLHMLERLVADTQDELALKNFRAWVGQLFAPRLQKLGFTPRSDEAVNESQQRISTLDAMTTLAHDQAAVAEAQRWAEREAADPKAVDPNLAYTFISAAAQFGDAALFERYARLYQQRKENRAAPQEVTRYLYSFASFRPPELVAQTLSLMDENVIPKEGIGPVLRSMLGRRHTRVAAWEYVKANWPKMDELGMTWIGNLIEAAGQLPDAYRADYVAFCETHLNGKAPMSYARGLETMAQLAELKARTKEELVAWLHGVNDKTKA